MTKKRDHALDILESPRGKFILSQALYVAAEELRKSDTEKSNREDMEILQEIFGDYRMVKGVEKEVAAVAQNL